VPTAITDHSPAELNSAPRFGPMLLLWMTLTIALQGVLWACGVRTTALAVAVERGAARIETRGIGEVGDDVIRKAIRLQRASLAFWTTLALLGDFVVEPLSLAVRAIVVAVVLSSLAALVGRPSRFGAALAACAAAQGFWVLGLAVRVVLMLALRRGDVETSLALLLPPGSYPAATWVALRQADAFALLGWMALARGGWRRGQVHLATAVLVCAVLALGEAAVRISATLMIEAGMRLTLLPE
jgi:hypothetical protein